MVFLSAAAFLSSALLISAQNLTSKRGMAFSAAETPGDIINANQTKSQISWQYDWGSIPPEYLAVDGIEYIPMQWGSANIEGFADAVQTQGAKTILVRRYLKSVTKPLYLKRRSMNPTSIKSQIYSLRRPLVSGNNISNL